MNSVQRRLLIEDRGRECVNCHGACPFGGGEKCNLPAKTLSAAAYWRLDSLRTPLGRLHVHHAFGKKHEGWNECDPLCPCCHARTTQGGGIVQEAVLAHLATVGPEPEEYRVAREQEAKDKPKRRARLKIARRVYRKKGNMRLEDAGVLKRPAKGAKRHGWKAIGEQKVKGLRLPSKTLEQMSRPVLNTFRT